MKTSLLIVYSNLGLGGIPKRIIDIINETGKSRPETKIYVLLKEHRDFDLRSTIRNRNVVIQEFHKLNLGDNAALFILWVWFWIFIRNPDTLLSFISPYALTILPTRFLFFWRKTNIIINEGHFTSTMIRSMALPAVQRIGIAVLYPLADIIIAPTEAIKNDLIHSYHLLPKTITVVPNWSLYASRPLYRGNRIYDCIYIGRMDKTKNILSLIKILERVIKHSKPLLTCLMVGDGPDKSLCAGYINVHGLNKNIRLISPVADVSEYLNKTKVFLFYPDKKTEGFPVAVLDAMACGTLVVTKNFEGAKEVICPSNGYIISADQQMERCIVHVLNRYKSQRPIIRSAKLRVSRYNSVRNTHSYMCYFS